MDESVLEGKLHLTPVVCSVQELFAGPPLDYLILDLHDSPGGPYSIHAILRARPDILLLVGGPQGNDELALQVISAGARGYLDLTSDVDSVRQAIEVVANGSIAAPPRLLSKLIDRLLKVSDSSLTNAPVRLTPREKQVADLILTAQSNREISRHLGIDKQTVTGHVGRMMRKTGTVNRIELALFMQKQPGQMEPAFEN